MTLTNLLFINTILTNVQYKGLFRQIYQDKQKL